MSMIIMRMGDGIRNIDSADRTDTKIVLARCATVCAEEGDADGAYTLERDGGLVGGDRAGVG
jgi:hypothetical protein